MRKCEHKVKLRAQREKEEKGALLSEYPEGYRYFAFRKPSFTPFLF
jgi:hypothetical protein